MGVAKRKRRGKRHKGLHLDYASGGPSGRSRGTRLALSRSRWQALLPLLRAQGARRQELVASFPSLAASAHSNPGISLQGGTLAYVVNRTAG